MNLVENYNQLKQEAYTGLQKRASSKQWIRMLEAAPIFLGSMTRGRLLLAVNAGMRILDDIADGDRLPPQGISPVAYLTEKRAFVRNLNHPQDNLDYLFLYCYQLADKAGLQIHRELDAFFEYFLFDTKRRGTGHIFTQLELDQAYDACDITGTIRGGLMVFGDDPKKAELLMPLGKAVRKYYTLRDYEADISAGFVNIPRESVKAHDITKDDFPNRFSPSVRAWFYEEALSGLHLLEEHNRIMQRERFAWRGRLALPIAYTRPTRAYFEAILRDQN
ncbi:MAG: hypothetical protein AAB414_01980 [Patescibacteria group bacterium]